MPSISNTHIQGGQAKSAVHQKLVGLPEAEIVRKEPQAFVHFLVSADFHFDCLACDLEVRGAPSTKVGLSPRKKPLNSYAILAKKKRVEVMFLTFVTVVYKQSIVPKFKVQNGGPNGANSTAGLHREGHNHVLEQRW